METIKSTKPVTTSGWRGTFKEVNSVNRSALDVSSKREKYSDNILL
jgi:hypothetical protein